MANGNGSVRLSEEIPEFPPADPEERDRLEWQMLRENYRIARHYDRLTMTTKTVVTVLLWLAGAIATIAAGLEVLRSFFGGTR